MKPSTAEKWLKCLAVVHIVGGLLLPMLALTSLIEPYLASLENKFSSSNSDSLRFMLGVFGPTVASWGLLFYFAVHKAFISKTHKEWQLLIMALLIWALLDSIYSLYFGITIHILINGITLLLFLFPLLIVRKQFK